MWLLAGWLAGGRAVFVLLSLAPGAILFWQVQTLDAKSPGNAHRRFKANHWVGVALTLAILFEAWI
jgi:4-hydroxybenzoate polyprenyltransferase